MHGKHSIEITVIWILRKHIHGYNILTIDIINNTLREHSLPLPSGGPGSQGKGVQGGGSNTFWVSLSHSYRSPDLPSY